MDLSNKFLQLPKAVIASYFEDERRVLIEGPVKVKPFEKNFQQTLRGAVLTPEKAVYLAMQVPVRPLRSIQDSLK